MAKTNLVKQKNNSNSGVFKGNLTLLSDANYEQLTQVTGFADFQNSTNLYLPKLEKVKKGLFLQGSKIKILPQLTSVQGSLNAYNSKLASLPELKEVGGDFVIGKKMDYLPNLKRVGGRIIFEKDCQIVDLPQLKHIDTKDGISFENTTIKYLPNLTKVNGYIIFGNTQIDQLPNLQYVGGFIEMLDTNLIYLPNLEFCREIVIRNSENRMVARCDVETYKNYYKNAQLKKQKGNKIKKQEQGRE